MTNDEQQQGKYKRGRDMSFKELAAAKRDDDDRQNNGTRRPTSEKATIANNSVDCHCCSTLLVRCVDCSCRDHVARLGGLIDKSRPILFGLKKEKEKESKCQLKRPIYVFWR